MVSLDVAPEAPTTITVAEPERSEARVGVGRIPGLDGLRGIAVAVVVLFHLGRLQGGFLGVDLFFVLSGFLITSLLLGEVESTGTVGLGGFWSRRARRLLPALFLVLIGVSFLLLRYTIQPQRARFRGDVLATLGYVANWHRMGSHLSYWDMFSQPSPLDHMWSLAIEEQFYVVWPLLLVGVVAVARRRGWGSAGLVGLVAGLLGAGSLAGLAWAFKPGDTNFAYFSTPTRLGPTLLGSALAAFSLHSSRSAALGSPGDGSRWWDVTGLVGLGVIGWLIVDVNGVAATYYRGGLALLTLASLVVIRAVSRRRGGVVSWALSFPPLRVLGLISYGVYLWHWPVIVYATPQRTGLSDPALAVVRIGLTLVAAGISYVVVERPIRRGMLTGWGLRVVGAGAATVTLVVGLVATSGTPAQSVVGVPDGPLAGIDTPGLHVPSSVAPGAVRVLLVGDSGPQHLGPELVGLADPSRHAVAFASEIDCTPTYPDGKARLPDGQVVQTPVCPEQRRALYSRLAQEFDPDVVVYYLANAGGVGAPHLDGRWVHDCVPAYDAYMQREMRRDADLLAADGARVVFTTVPYIGVSDPRSADQVDCRNSLVRSLAASRANTSVVDMHGFVLGKVRSGEKMFVDSVHLSPHGAQLVSQWLLPQLGVKDVK